MAARDYELLLKVRADMKQALGQLNRLQAAYSKNATAGERAAHKLDSAFKRLNGTMYGLRNIIIGTFAVHEVGNFTRKLVDANVEMQRIHYGLQQAFGSSKEADKQFKFVADTAQRLGLNLVDAAEGYKDLAAAAQGTGTSAQQLQHFFTGLSEAATVLHLNSADLNGILIQLSQGLSLGRLQMQDLRAVAQHLPGTFSLLSGALQNAGLNMGKLLKEGGLPAIQTLDLLGKALHDRFGQQAVEASHSLNSEINRLHSSVIKLETTGSDGGFLSGITQAIKNLTKTLNDPKVQTGFTALIDGLGTVANKATQALSYVSGFAKYIGEQFARDAGHFAIGDTSGIEQRIAAIRARIKTLEADKKQGPYGYMKALVTEDRQSGQTRHRQRQGGYTIKGELQNLINQWDHLNSLLNAGKNLTKPASTKGATGPRELPTLTVTYDPKAAAKRAKHLAEAEHKLAGIMGGLQGKLGPVSKAWHDYAKAVQAAAEAGGKAIANGANVGQVQAQVARAVRLANQARSQSIADLHRNLQVQLFKATGQQAAASAIEIERKYGAMEQDLLANGDKVGAALVRKLMNVQAARAQLQQLEAEVQRAFDAQSRTEQSVQAQVAAGYLTQYEAQQKIVDAHQKTIAVVDQLLPKMRELAAATGDPAVIARVQDITGQVENLKLTANQAAQSIKNAFRDGLGSAINNLVQGTQTLGQAVRGFIRNMVAALAQLATNRFLDSLLNGKGGQGGSGGGGWMNTAINWVAGYFGGGKAGGGLITGPGTGTSDSILTPTSTGEFVNRAAVVAQPGALPFLSDFNRRGMQALADWGNRFRGFAQGGLVGAGVQAAAMPAPRVTQGGLQVSGGGVAHLRLVAGLDGSVLNDWAKSSAFEDAIKVTISRNPSFIRHTLRAS